MINDKITLKKLESYFSITAEALLQAKDNFDEKRIEQARDFWNMANAYYQDAKFFQEKKQDYVLAFGALNYAHGWLDAGARIKLFLVKDSRLFTVDEQ